jgi:competence protein ComEA
MSDLTPRQLALAGLAALMVVVLAGSYALHARPSSGGASGAAPALAVASADPGGGAVVVHVAGAVRAPGVYRLKAGQRVDDALTRAGGPRPRADLSALNLAAKLEDGRQVLVPLRAPAGGATPAAAGTAAAVPGAASVPAAPIDLNTATAEQLDQLDGVGPATAQHILQFRQEHGGFGSVEELDQVAGIGPKRLATLRKQVRV